MYYYIIVFKYVYLLYIYCFVEIRIGDILYFRIIKQKNTIVPMGIL